MTPSQRYLASDHGKAHVRAYRKKYRARPEVKARHAAQQRTRYYSSAGQAYAKAYRRRPDVRERANVLRDNPAWREKHRSYQRARISGVSETMFAALWRVQRGRCAICRVRMTPSSAKRDHCHDTKTPRGLLCSICNMIEGALKGRRISPVEFGRRLAAYLKAPSARKVAK